MGNKMKKLICSLLASAMLVTSAGVVAFADADTATDEGDLDVEAAQTVDTPATPAETTVEATEAPAADAEATEAPAADAEATEAPAVTEAPAATEAPAVTTSSGDGSYENDDYYKKALTLDSALGIISGYEDGSVRPESKVTRAQMASIVLRMLNLSGESTYKNIFTDVDASHWAAGQIQAAYEAGIVSGMGDGTFAPDSEVTYAQVIVMLVNAMNYTNDAEYYGGWQQGYIKTAGDIGLLKNASGSADVPSDRGVVIKMVYNALLNDYNNPTSYDAYGNPKYDKDKTLAEVKFDVIEKKGVLQGTAKTTILPNTDVQDGQIAIKPDGADDATVYDTELTGLEDYLAQKVTYYYKEFGGRTTVVYAVIPDNAKSETYVIDDLDTIESMKGFEDGAGKIKIEKVSKEKDCTGAMIVFNGKVITKDDYDKAKADAKGANALRFLDSFDDFITPENGSIRLVKTDSSNDTYDVVFIDSYETVIVTTATATKLSGNISLPAANAATASEITGKTAYSLDVDTKTVDRTVTVTKAGDEARLRNLKKDDVANIKRSIDDTVVDIVVADESITGSATGVTIKLNDSHATVNGDKYEVANIAVNDLKTGVQSTFHLDMFGRIAFIEASTTGKLESNEKYGWIMSAYDSENKQDYVIQMYTTDGKAVEMAVSDSVDYWAPNSKTKSDTLKGSDIKTTIDKNIKNANNELFTVAGTPIRLVKYKTNSSGKITRLYFPVDKDNVSDDSGALRVDPNNLEGKKPSSGLVKGYQINDGIIEFNVPNSVSKMNDASSYSIGEVKASNYVVKENGSSRDFIVGEFTTTTTPSILVNMIAGADEVASLDDIDTAGNNPVMMVDSIDTDLDSDDNVVYTINGYINGETVSVTTTNNTVLGKLTVTDRGQIRKTNSDNKKYNTTKLWDAQNGDAKGEKEADGSDKDIRDYLKEGDLLMYAGSEKLMIVLSVDDAYNIIYDAVKKENTAEGIEALTSHPKGDGSTTGLGAEKGVLFGGFSITDTRNDLAFAALEDTDIEDNAWFTTIGNDDYDKFSRISFDAGKFLDVVEININTGEAKINEDGLEAAELEIYDYADSKTGDFMFARCSDKGALREVMVYRFVK